MKWSPDLKTVGRGLRLASKVAKSELGQVLLFGQAAPLRQPADDRGKAPPQERNPGGLRMLSHVPATIKPDAPLVVVLHGCGQQATAFAEASGWVALADQLGFTLLMPEQAEENNHGRCFRWFLPAQASRGVGEAASIVNMVRSSVSTCGSDPRRVYVVGLSAGGAMAAALLASYPDVFAGGAAIDGLPVGTAHSSVQALMRMTQAGPSRTAREWADLAKQSGPSGFRGPWPRLSVWVGEGDTVVAPENGLLLAEQWRTVHGCGDAPADDEYVATGVRRRSWGPPAAPQVELWVLEGAPHGYPVGEGIGHEAAYVHRSHVAATRRIAAFWGLERSR